jgi:hypothetical protein
MRATGCRVVSLDGASAEGVAISHGQWPELRLVPGSGVSSAFADGCDLTEFVRLAITTIPAENASGSDAGDDGLMP